MTQELIYTSAPRGLKPSSQGFCTVASTPGMSQPVAGLLEGLTGYRPLFPPGHEREGDNPIQWSHLHTTIGGRTHSILARIAASGLDYSGRNNKLAHLVLLDDADIEGVPAGPAWCLAQPGFVEREWHGEPRLLPPDRLLPSGIRPPRICTAWQTATGDAGWAGVVAEAFLEDPSRPAYFLFEPGQDLLPLFEELVALLPQEQRWDATFSTYFTSVSPNVVCRWRCVVKGSAEAHDSRRFVKALRIDLTVPASAPEGGPLAALARTGRDPREAARPPAAAAPLAGETPEPSPEEGDDEDDVTFEVLDDEPAASLPAGAGEYRLSTAALALPGAALPPPPPSTARRREKRSGVWLLAMGVVALLAVTASALLVLSRPAARVEAPHFVAGAEEPMVVQAAVPARRRLIDGPLPEGWTLGFAKPPLGVSVRLTEEGVEVTAPEEILKSRSTETFTVEIAPAANTSGLPTRPLTVPVLILPPLQERVATGEVDAQRSGPVELSLLQSGGEKLPPGLTLAAGGKDVLDAKGDPAKGIRVDPERAQVVIDPAQAEPGEYQIALTVHFAMREYRHQIPTIPLRYREAAAPVVEAPPAKMSPTPEKALEPLVLKPVFGRGFRVPLFAVKPAAIRLVAPASLPEGLKLDAAGFLEGTPTAAGTTTLRFEGTGGAESLVREVRVEVREWFDNSVIEAASDGDKRTVQWIELPSSSDDPLAKTTFPGLKRTEALGRQPAVRELHLHVPLKSTDWKYEKPSRFGSPEEAQWILNLHKSSGVAPSQEGAGDGASREPIAVFRLEFSWSNGALEAVIRWLGADKRDVESEYQRALEMSVLECVLQDGTIVLLTFAPDGAAESQRPVLLGAGHTITESRGTRYACRTLKGLFDTSPVENHSRVLVTPRVNGGGKGKSPARVSFVPPGTTAEQKFPFAIDAKTNGPGGVSLARISEHEPQGTPWGLSSCELVLRPSKSTEQKPTAGYEVVPLVTFNGQAIQFIVQMSNLKNARGKSKREIDDEERRYRAPRPLSQALREMEDVLGLLTDAWGKEPEKMIKWRSQMNLKGSYKALDGVIRKARPKTDEDFVALKAIREEDAFKVEVQLLQETLSKITKSPGEWTHLFLFSRDDVLQSAVDAEKTVDWLRQAAATAFAIRIDLELPLDGAPDGAPPVRRRLIDIGGP